MASAKEPVLVLGTTENVSIDIARSLRQASIPVFLVNPRNRQWILKSNLFDKVFPIPKSNTVISTWFNDLEQIGISLFKEYNKKILIISSDDIDLSLLSRFETELSKYFVIPGSNDSPRLAEIIDKSFVDAKLGDITRPKSIIYTGSKKILDKIDFSPILVKPVVRDEGNNFSREQGKFKLFRDKKELEFFLDTIDSKYGNLILQSFVKKTPSNEYSWIGYVSKDGEFTGLTVKKTRQIPIGAGTTFAEITHNYDLEAESKSIISKIGFWGICEVEYLYNREEDNFYFLEFNARPCRWFYLTTGVGLNLLELIFNDVNGISNNQKTKSLYKKEVKWVDIRTDFYYHVLKENDIKGNLWTRFMKWFLTVKGSELTFVTRSDPLLLFIEFKRSFRMLFNFFIRRLDKRLDGEIDSKTLYYIGVRNI